MRIYKYKFFFVEIHTFVLCFVDVVTASSGAHLNKIFEYYRKYYL